MYIYIYYGIYQPGSSRTCRKSMQALARLLTQRMPIIIDIIIIIIIISSSSSSTATIATVTDITTIRTIIIIITIMYYY